MDASLLPCLRNCQFHQNSFPYVMGYGPEKERVPEELGWFWGLPPPRQEVQQDCRDSSQVCSALGRLFQPQWLWDSDPGEEEHEGQSGAAVGCVCMCWAVCGCAHSSAGAYLRHEMCFRFGEHLPEKAVVSVQVLTHSTEVQPGSVLLKDRACDVASFNSQMSW